MVVNQWLTQMSARLQGGKANVCEFGHASHDLMTVSITAPFHRHLRVFNWMRYETPTPGYCTGKDEVSKGIQSAGWWELPASSLVCELLQGTEGPVLDFGAHIGWYGVLAENCAHPYLGFEADEERVSVMQRNAPCAVVCRTWVGEDTPELTPAMRVPLAKIDTDGSEAHVLRVCEPLLARNLIDAVLMEVDGRDVGPANQLIRHGFTGFWVPSEQVSLAQLRESGPGTWEPFEGQRDALFLR